MLVFLFALLIILSIIILLLVLTTIQIQINNLIIKDGQRKDGEVKIVFKLLKVIPYLEINLLDSHFMKKEIQLKKYSKQRNKISLENLLKIAKLQELYVKLNLQSEKLILLTFITVLMSTILSIIFTKNMISEDEGKYSVNMKFGNDTKYELYITSILNVKIIHIISVMCENLIKRRVDTNARKPYTRTYEYNYE